MKIKAYVGYDERRGRRYWREFELLDKLPEAGDRFGPVEGEEAVRIEAVRLDAEQGDMRVYNYTYWRVDTKDALGEEGSYYVCVELPEDERPVGC